jgi:excisionase family DNA binding protein
MKEGTRPSPLREPTMRPAQAAEYLGISRDTVIRMVEEGILRGYRHRPGGWWKVSKASVLEHERKLSEQAGVEKDG